MSKPLLSLYTLPAPSLCDDCIYAYHLQGGSVSWGRKTYRQRYCDALTKAIHDSGAAECGSYKQRAPLSDTPLT